MIKTPGKTFGGAIALGVAFLALTAPVRAASNKDTVVLHPSVVSSAQDCAAAVREFTGDRHSLGCRASHRHEIVARHELREPHRAVAARHEAPPMVIGNNSGVAFIDMLTPARTLNCPAGSTKPLCSEYVLLGVSY